MHSRSVADFNIQGLYPLSFRKRVQTRLKWSERDQTDPEQVCRTMIEIAMVLEREGVNRALDEEMGWKRRPGSLQQRDDKDDNSNQHRSAGGSLARVGVGTGDDMRQENLGEYKKNAELEQYTGWPRDIQMS